MTDPLGEVAPANPPTEEELRATAWADEAVSKALPNLRATALAWQTSLSTIIGFFGAATLIGAGGEVGKLEPPYDLRFGLLTLAALCACGAALYLASVAASHRSGTIEQDRASKAQAYDDAIKAAESNLERSRTTTFFAVVFLVGAMAVLWYAPRKPADPPTIPQHQHEQSGPVVQ